MGYCFMVEHQLDGSNDFWLFILWRKGSSFKDMTPDLGSHEGEINFNTAHWKFVLFLTCRI